jgi:hypothetical protein
MPVTGAEVAVPGVAIHQPTSIQAIHTANAPVSTKTTAATRIIATGIAIARASAGRAQWLRSERGRRATRPPGRSATTASSSP